MAAKSRVRRTSRWIAAAPFAAGGALIGLLFGLLGMAVAALAGGTAPAWLPLGPSIAAGATAFLLRAFFIQGSLDLFRRVYLGGDPGTTPEYSVARGLEIRGQYEAALEAYTAGAAEYPEDPEPLLLGARLLRTHLDRPGEALAWLERARRLPDLTPRDEILIDRDVVELYEGPLRNPAAALPVLARLSARHAGTKPAEWAARRLASLRTEVWQNIRDDEVEDLTGY